MKISPVLICSHNTIIIEEQEITNRNCESKDVIIIKLQYIVINLLLL